MGTQYLIDTNSVIEFMSGALPISGSNWLQNIYDQNQHYLSVINQIEILGFNGSSTEMQAFEEFIQASHIFPLSDVVVQKTIDLRKAYKIKLPDAIIAATASIYHLTIVTRNTSDFAKIEGIAYINPHDK